MAFSHGAAAKLYAGGYQLSKFLQNVNLGNNLSEDDVTTIGQTTTPFYKSYLAGSSETVLTADGLFDGNSEVYDPTLTPPHPGIDYVLQAALGSTAGTVLSYLPYGDGFGYYGYGLNADETKYNIVKVAEQVVKVNAEFRSKTGLARAVVLEADGTVHGGNGNGTAIDQGAPSLLGASAFLQVRVWGGLISYVTVEHSADNITFSTLITFDNVAAEPEAQYKSVTGTVYRYVRAYWGTVSSIAFHLLFCRKA